MAFQYKRRSAEDIEKRANQKGGDFIDIFLPDFKVYKPKRGDNAVRFLPPSYKGARHYGLDVWAHHDIGPDRASLLCLAKMQGTRCPLCEARIKAEQAGDSDTAKTLRPRRRVLTWMIDLKDERLGPQLWAQAWTLDRDITKISQDKATGTYSFIDDPEEGYDVYFEREGEGLNTEYVGAQLAKRPSSVPKKYLDYIEEHPLTDVLDYRTAAEMKAIYEGSVGEDDDTPKQPRRGGAEAREREDEPEERPAPRGRGRTRDDEPGREEPRARPVGRRSASEPEDEPPAPGGEDDYGGGDRDGDRSASRRAAPERETARPRRGEDEPEPARSTARGGSRAEELRETFRQNRETRR